MGGYGAILEGADGIGKPLNFDAYMQSQQLMMQKDAQAAAQAQHMAKMEADRQQAALGYINGIDGKEFKPAEEYQGFINKDLYDLKQAATDYSKNRPGDLSGLQEFINQRSQKIGARSDKSRAIQESAAKAAAMADKGINKAALQNIILKDGLYKRLLDGSQVPLTADEMQAQDPEMLLNSIIEKHYDKVIEPGTPFLSEILKDPNGKEVQAETTLDGNGNIVVTGAKVKIPYYMREVRDAKGNLQRPEVITEPFKVDGKVMEDENGIAKVVPDDVYHQYMDKPSSVKGEVLRTFKYKYPGLNPASTEGEMRKRQILTSLIEQNADYKFDPDDAGTKSRNYKDKLADNTRAAASLAIQEKRLSLAEEAASFRQQNPTAEFTGNFLAEVNDRYGSDISVLEKPAQSNKKLTSPSTWFAKPTTPTYVTKRIIPETADAKDIDLVAGKIGASGKRPIPPQVFTTQSGEIVKGWEYDAATGKAKGKGGVEINPDAVDREYKIHIGKKKEIKTGNSTPKKEASKPKAKEDPMGIL